MLIKQGMGNLRIKTDVCEIERNLSYISFVVSFLHFQVQES